MVSSYSLSCNTVHTKTAVPEIIDFGYPQNSEADTLKTYITTESIVSSSIAAVRITLWSEPRLPAHGITGGILQNHSASYGLYKLAEGRCQVQEE